MGRIPEETIEAIRNRVDIVELVGRYVALRQAGRSFKGLCPFHHEKTPSFHVNPQLGIFHCFGCAAGGNAFAFLMRHDNLTFPEAVRVLARDCGIEVPEDRSLWRGGCFVFDDRVALGHGLVPTGDANCPGCRHPLQPGDLAHPDYEEGVSCPRCRPGTDPARLDARRTRHRQMVAADSTRPRGCSR